MEPWGTLRIPDWGTEQGRLGESPPGPLRILLYMGRTRATNGGAVDGSEIRRSPVEIGSRNPIIYKVLEYISGGARFQPWWHHKFTTNSNYQSSFG